MSRYAEWLAGALLALLAAGCGKSHDPVPVSQPRELDPAPRARLVDHSASSALVPDYLTRPDTGERRILGQLLHELRLARHLIDEAHARRDERARVRVDYARLADEFDRIMTGLRRTLAVSETAPRDSVDITGDYRSHE